MNLTPFVAREWRKVTDENQNIVWAMHQTPVGEITLDTEAVRMPMRFPGQYADIESGYNYNYFRDYDPTLGRYVEPDPIGQDGGINSFIYVLATPTTTVDPTGQCPVCVVVGVIAIKAVIGGVATYTVAHLTGEPDPVKQGLFAAAFSAVAAPGVAQLAEQIGLREISTTVVTAGIGNAASQITLKGTLNPAEVAEASALAVGPAAVTRVAASLGYSAVASEATGAYLGVGESVFEYGFKQAIHMDDFCPNPR